MAAYRKGKQVTAQERIDKATAYMENLINQQGGETPYAWVGFFDDLLHILQEGKDINEPTHPHTNIGIIINQPATDDCHTYSR